MCSRRQTARQIHSDTTSGSLEMRIVQIDARLLALRFIRGLNYQMQ